MDDYQESIREISRGSLELFEDQRTKAPAWSILVKIRPSTYMLPTTGEYLGVADSPNQQKRWLNLLLFDFEHKGCHFKKYPGKSNYNAMWQSTDSVGPEMTIWTVGDEKK